MAQTRTYKTSEIAELFDLHPNTIRLYAQWGFISTPERAQNGYRIFTHEHIQQVQIARLALKTEVLQNGLRKQAIGIIQAVAQRRHAEAIALTDAYLAAIEQEIAFSEDAIKMTENILADKPIAEFSVSYSRQQAADHLQVTIDTLRNWERNGLLRVQRKQNGYRIYEPADMQILTIIRTLRTANYSLSAILRMLGSPSHLQSVDLKKTLNTPDDGEFIITACDRLIDSLKQLKTNATRLKTKINALFSAQNPPL